MLNSMTGYGRAEHSIENRRFSVEIRSVNHRYNDITIKLPRVMNHMEEDIRKILFKDIKRGKTDVYIHYESFSEDDFEVKANINLAKAYDNILSTIADELDIKTNDRLRLVALFPEVVSVEKKLADDDLIWTIFKPALIEALENFLEMRNREGKNLEKDIVEKSKKLDIMLNDIEQLYPQILENQKNKIRDKLSDLILESDFEENRILSEIIIYSDKIDVDEELIRLKSHIKQLRACLLEADSVGRKLDFIIQEMNREANTIASKSSDLTVSKIAVDLKSEIEKIREQVQNIE